MKPLIILAALLPCIAFAEVADSSAGGFTVKIDMNIQAQPEEVFKKFVQNVGDWWNSAHTWSGDAHNLTIDAKPMGCFCEKLPNGGGVRHMEVVFASPGKALVMKGELGPMQVMAASGSMQVRFTAADGGTKLSLGYAVTGYLPGGMNAFAPRVDEMLNEQLTRFKSYVEKTVPAAK
jgi:uncharacterized protein YndB with AHSA1/START domain